MTMLNRFDPQKDFQRLHDELNRWFDDGMGFGKPGESLGWLPPVDIFEDAEGLTLKFDLPEVDPKDVSIDVENGVLTLRGERKLEHADQRERYHRIERAHGTFTRSFSLPATLASERITAEAKHGVLRIFVPRREEARPRSIQVKVSA